RGRTVNIPSAEELAAQVKAAQNPSRTCPAGADGRRRGRTVNIPSAEELAAQVKAAQNPSRTCPAGADG
ncbi:hypothetical protein B1A92_12595, partial [Neisseria meningitidis]